MKVLVLLPARSRSQITRRLLANSLLVAFLAPMLQSAIVPEAKADARLNAAAAQALCSVSQEGETAAANRAKLAGIVEAERLPSFDFPRMTQLALARNWHLASAVQQTMLIAEFETLLLRWYALAHSNERKRAMELKRLSTSAGATELRVKSEAKQAGREGLRIAYDMNMTPAGWKVYDIKVGGASLIAMYRESFARAVREGGIEGLIELLSDNNRQAHSGAESATTTFRDHALIVFAVLQSALQGRR